MYFEELMVEPDFKSALDRIIPEFRERFALPGIHQLGLVVADVEEAALHLEAQGVAPFFIASGSPAFWIERDEKRSFRGKMGLSRYRGVELELLEAGEGSDFYRCSLDSGKRIVVQHLGFFVEDVEAWVNKFVAAGFPARVRGGITIGPGKTQFAYMDTGEKAGIIVEFISRRTFGLRWWPLGTVFRLIARLQKWSKKRNFPLYPGDEKDRSANL